LTPTNELQYIRLKDGDVILAQLWVSDEDPFDETNFEEWREVKIVDECKVFGGVKL